MKTARIFLALLIAVAVPIAFMSEKTAFADSPPNFKTFPTLGRCTGNNVRLREDPDTGSKILGKLNEGNCVVVLNKLITEGNIWYEVDNPAKKGRAFVFGKYLEAVYEESYQSNRFRQFLMNLYLTYGMTPEKAVELWGKPQRRKREVISSEKIEFVTLEWNTHRLEYWDKELVSIGVSKGSSPFGKVRIGDSVEKLEHNFGMPLEKHENDFIYADQSGDASEITLNTKNNKVSGMYYTLYYEVPE